tara:strand:- start:232 stop:507 length:276 start_codon:yes stop_codon:yes gene_type:complete
VEDYNYFVYFVGISHPDGLFKQGDCGVGFTDSGPGIRDCRYGTMYVIPNDVVFHRRPSADYVKQCAIKYFGSETVIKKVKTEEEIRWVKTN